jgi:ABC-type polysaccharide/polyol phosphate transport system ATPase subunit
MQPEGIEPGVEHAAGAAGDDRPVRIRLDGVSKRYVLHKQKPFLVREVFHRLVGRTARHEEFWALRDVTLDVFQGEAVAFIGHNGAGKSTILGMVARTLHPTSGNVTVNGRLGTLLELGAGFHPDLTGRENIYLNASLLGLDRDEIEARYESIVEFSELTEFIDVPVRNYSSGMQVRLGFSVAIHVTPDILIMDEVLAVGDEAFQHKCLERIQEFQRQNVTLLFVSHSMVQVQHLCQRVVWLDHGRVRAVGDAATVTEAYLQSAT